MDFDKGWECNELVAGRLFVEMVLLQFSPSLAWTLMPVIVAAKAMQIPTISLSFHHSVFIIYLWWKEKKRKKGGGESASRIKMQGYAKSS